MQAVIDLWDVRISIPRFIIGSDSVMEDDMCACFVEGHQLTRGRVMSKIKFVVCWSKSHLNLSTYVSWIAYH